MKIAPLFAALVLPLAAHPDPRHTLEEINSHLAQTPEDQELLRQKAQVYLSTGNPGEAAAIFLALQKLGPDEPANLLLDARVALAKDERESSAAKARALVARHARFDRGWKFLAQAEESVGRRDAALAAMLRYLEISAHPEPGEVLTCAGWLQGRGATGDLETAVAVLDGGLAKAGCLSGLHHKAIEIELGLGHYDSALRRIDALAARFRPSVDLSLKRADILEKAERFKEAADACDSALALMDALPATRKRSDAFQQQFAAMAKRKAANLEKPGS
ncbi:tetratricopeptide repeat protein [Luteolibacter sp. Populi]|uniref:tetratricopeptide repeat protein n=1 Tax=Luteolibacter sp. Populi TaxID=3230487 RepID=UPI003467CBAD